MFRRSLLACLCLSLVVGLGLGQPALAKKNNPVVDLVYVPQQNVNQVEARLDPVQRTTPVALRFVDGRHAEDPAFVGTRTDDRDRRFELTAATAPLGFIERTVERILRDWGLAIDPAAGLVLELEPIDFFVHEANQAVGATFESEVAFKARLVDGERVVWSGRAGAGATRYGRKFSNDNVNEVLSDGLLETVAQLVSERSLQQAWAGKPSATSTTRLAARATGAVGAAREAISPEKLLEELKTFEENGFELATVVEYLKRKALSRPLEAADLAALKESGVPEDVIRSVVNLPSL